VGSPGWTFFFRNTEPPSSFTVAFGIDIAAAKTARRPRTAASGGSRSWKATPPATTFIRARCGNWASEASSRGNVRRRRRRSWSGSVESLRNCLGTDRQDGTVVPTLTGACPWRAVSCESVTHRLSLASALIVSGQFLLPDSQNPPTAPAQLTIHKPITCLVARKLLPPESSIGRWLRRMPWTTAPKAAVHEDDDTLANENEVRE